MLGEPAILSPPAGPPDLDGLRARLDANEAVAHQLESQLAGELARGIAQNQTAADGIATRLQGYLGTALSDSELKAGAMAGKLKKHLLKRLGNAYTYAFPHGIIYPTTDQVVYGLESGDILGSMGLAPAVESGAQDSIGAIPAGPVETATPVGPATVPVGLPGVPAYSPGAPVAPPPTRGTPVYFDQAVNQVDASGQGTCPPGSHWESGFTPVPLAPSPPQTPPWPGGPPGTDTGKSSGNSSSSGGPTGRDSPGEPVTPFEPLEPPSPEPPAGTTNETCPTDCPAQIWDGWEFLYPYGSSPIPASSPYIHPWVQQTPPHAGMEMRTECLNGNCFVPPRPRPVCLQVPKGYALYVDPRSGTLWAAYLPLEGWIPVKGCELDTSGGDLPFDPGGIDPVPTIPPPGQCVPDVPTGPPEVCPAPDVPTCGPTFGGQLPQLVGATNDVCKAIEVALEKIRGQNADVAKWIGMTYGSHDKEGVVSQVMRALLGVENPVLPDLVNRFGGWLQKVLKKANEGINCEPLTLLPIIINRAVFRFIQQWTGAVPTQLLTQIDQLSNTACQSLLPTQDEADRAYMMGVIDQALWECWTKAAGHHVKEAQAVRDASRHKLSARETVRLKMRELLTDDRYDKLVRQNGVVTPEDERELWDSEQAWPTPSQLISWLVRDVFDEDTVKLFELDTDFDAKFTDETAKYAAGAGVNYDQLKYDWRAHWRHVGTGLMLDAFHRLRPGHVPKDLEMTREDLEKALKQEDIPPYWIRRIIHLSYAKPTRVDVRRMFELHQIDEKELRERVLDLGYSEKDADKLVDYWCEDRKQKELRKVGYPAPRSLVNAYAKGEITRDELRGFAVKIAYYDGQANEILESADWARDQATRKMAIQATKRRYTAGLLSRGDAAGELGSVGIDGDEIDNLIRWWDRVKDKRGREVTASMLCQWRKAFLIGPSDQLAALIRIGYSGADAQMIVAECTYEMDRAAQRNTEKAQAVAMKAAAKAAANEAKSAKAQERKSRTKTASGRNGRSGGEGGP